ncbi:hypothetical protein ABN148_27010, partial [Klebsiella oxytoca]
MIPDAFPAGGAAHRSGLPDRAGRVARARRGFTAPPPGRGKGLQQRFRFRDNVVHGEAKLFKQLLR